MIPRFRAWHCELGVMMSIKNMWFQNNMLEELELNNAAANDYITAYPDEVELMQSTGLKDKNGKEIFEGDIVDYKGRKAVIKWHGSYASFIYMFVEDLKNRNQEWEPLYLSYYHFEIVGNKFENPELLEVSS